LDATEGLAIAVKSFDLQAVWEDTLARYPYLTPAAPFKTIPLYAIYNNYLPTLRPVRNLMELGIYQGGSLILWREALRCRVIGIDLASPAPTMPAVERYLSESGDDGQVKLFWKTDQADEKALRSIVAGCEGPLDIVVDDASHLYWPTRRSFEILFPLVRPGGAYFIEDWGAGILPEFQTPEGTIDQVLKDLLDWIRDGKHSIESMFVNAACAVIRKAE